MLIGGANKAYRLTLRRLGEIADAVAAILRTAGGSALVTPSRRTGASGARAAARSARGLSASVWDGSGENPYFAYLALADAFLVTADSVSMISEAAATGKPVHVLDLAGGNAKFARFHAAMQAGRHYPAVRRADRVLVLPGPGRYRARRRGAARTRRARSSDLTIRLRSD